MDKYVKDDLLNRIIRLTDEAAQLSSSVRVLAEERAELRKENNKLQDTVNEQQNQIQLLKDQIENENYDEREQYDDYEE